MRFDNCMPGKRAVKYIHLAIYIYISIYIGTSAVAVAAARQHVSRLAAQLKAVKISLWEPVSPESAPLLPLPLLLLCFPPLSSTPIAFWLSLRNPAPILKSFSHTTASHLGPEMFTAKRNQRSAKRPRTRRAIMKFSPSAITFHSHPIYPLYTPRLPSAFPSGISRLHAQSIR